MPWPGQPWFSRRVPFTPQMEVAECGAACVSMVLGYHGHHAPLAEVRQACNVSRDGANALALLRAARAYGLDGKGVQVDVGELGKLPLPAILHWDFNHFVVLERMSPNWAFLVDPAGKRRRMRLAQLGRHFTGVALVMTPTANLTLRPRARPSLGRYQEIFGRSMTSLVQILLASLGLQVVGLILPVASQILVDRVIVPRQEVWLWGLGIALAASVMTRALLALVRSYVVQVLQNFLDAWLLSQFVEHLLHLPLAFFLQRQSGDLVQRVQSNAAVRNLLGSQSVSAILDGFLLLGFAGLMLAYNPKLALLILSFALVRVIILAALGGRNQQVMAYELAAAGREGGALMEALTGLETTKASGAEARMVQRWLLRMKERINSALVRRRLAIGAGQAMAVLQGLTAASVFLIGGEEVVAQRMTLGVFASFTALQSLFMAPLETLLTAVSQLQYLTNHLRRLDDVLETAREATGSVDPGRLRGGIALREVSYSYAHGSPPVLQDVTLAIQPGERVAIVGRSGAGKSTLARLLLGMHLPSSGRIEFDGTDLRQLDLQKVRRQMGVVLQEGFLFDDTIRMNLSLGDEEVPPERLHAAATTACVADVIEALPLGYDSRVGENGSLLSGGQRQRLVLARALAGLPAIILLDEATSALDLETERRVHANLASLGCTRIVIAHRLATVRDADRILVLESGRIVQEGTYPELIGIGGPLRTMVEARELAHS